MMYYGSVAPVVVKDKLIVGVSGDDLDMPAYLDARNPKNGELIWRWYVTPQKAGDPGSRPGRTSTWRKHGGGMTWQPITYDPELNLIYVTTGNPQPVVAFKNREGANLYTASIVALNADTGKMAWYFQSSPHDTHDWDATQTPVLFDGTVNGQPRKLVAHGVAQRPLLRARSDQRQEPRLVRVHQDELGARLRRARASRSRTRPSGRRSPARS